MVFTFHNEIIKKTDPYASGYGLSRSGVEKIIGAFASKVLVLLVIASIWGCGSAQEFEADSAEPVSVPQSQEVGAPTIPVPGAYREEVLADLGLEAAHGLTDREVAQLTMEFVYWNNVWPNEKSTPIDVNVDFHRFYIDWKNGDAKFFCGGSSYVMAWILEELGVPARGVQLASQDFIDGKNEGETHVTTEVFLDREWIVYDPTFNVVFQCNNGKDASILDLVDCLMEGGEITWKPGEDYGAGHTIEEYPVPIERHLSAYSFNNPYSSRLRFEPGPEVPFLGWYE